MLLTPEPPPLHTDRHTQTDTDRQIDRQTQTDTDRQIDRQTQTDRHRQTGKQRPQGQMVPQGGSAGFVR